MLLPLNSANDQSTTAGQEKLSLERQRMRGISLELLHGGPDVIEELNLDHRLKAAGRHANGSPHDGRFRQGRIEDSFGAVFELQAGGQFENPSLAFDEPLLDVLLAVAVGHVFAEQDDARVAAHLVAQASMNQPGHGLFSPGSRRARF